jgi:hypothetical protein
MADQQKESHRMTNADPWAAAAGNGTQTQTASSGQVADTGGNLTTSFAGEQSQLFGGAVLPPSLMNKTHLLGTERRGRITVAPYDVQSRDFKTKKAKYWANSPLPDGKKVTTEPLDHVTGEKLRPVKDTVIELATEYRFSTAECAAIERDANMPDDGSRAFYASGDDLKQLRAEIRRLGLRSENDMIGLTFSVKRVGQKPNPGGNPSWINEIKLSR